MLKVSKLQDFNQALSYITALGGGIFDFRAIHDQNKGIPAIPFRGTIEECWNSIVNYNNQGYGIFTVVNELDGAGRDLINVKSVRSHFIDLDNINAVQNYERAATWQPSPAFAVQSSPNKFHVYWPVAPYLDNERFTLIQRKLVQFYDADNIIDATRVMRLPGTLHRKGDPILVTCWSLNGYGFVNPVENLELALQHVNVAETFQSRHDLGDPELAAPSLEWLQYALDNHDPNQLDRGEWISFTAAFKQAGWTLTTPDELYNKWFDWCKRYEFNDEAENLKQWNSISSTQLGWKSIIYRVPAVNGQMKLGDRKNPKPVEHDQEQPKDIPPMPSPPELDCSGELLTDIEQKEYFKDCFWISVFGKILTPKGRFLNATQFNGTYGGKKFIIDQDAKTVNEPWQAATRSTLWTIPKADHVRFLPHKKHLEIHTDELGRDGVNMYKPAIINSREGDPSLFLNHLKLILPVESDCKTLLDFFAHNVKYPGYKIPWSPLIQSAEGVGKGVFKAVMKHSMGSPYVYYPNAKELAESGSQFNAWMRAKLFILVDEIKTDDRRDMIEVLKPMISEEEIEIQGKGDNQEKEDNYSNWTFFSNWKDAIPVNKNGRRFSINYSQLQTAEDILNAGMNDQYFDNIFQWLKGGGFEIVSHYLLNYEIERGKIPMRAPITSSTKEALKQSRSPIEQLILDAVEDQLAGFRGGYVSTLAVTNRIKATGIRAVSPKTIQIILEGLGYSSIGRATRAYFVEDQTQKAELYHLDKRVEVIHYGKWQGYED